MTPTAFSRTALAEVLDDVEADVGLEAGDVQAILERLVDGGLIELGRSWGALQRRCENPS